MPINVTEIANKVGDKIKSATTEIRTVTGKITGSIEDTITQMKGSLSQNLSINPSNKAQIPSDLGIKKAENEIFTKAASREILLVENAPNGAPLKKINTNIPTLLQSEVKALMLQIAYMVSDNNETYNEPPLIGRYGTHTRTLVNYGYKFSSNLEYTGKDGIKTETDFVFDTKVQDKIMEVYLLDQYQALIKVGALKDYDTKEIVGGMLAVSYQFQDAGPTVSSLSSLSSLGSLGDPSTLAASGADLAAGLQSNLKSAAPSLANIESLAGASSVLPSAESLLSKVPSLSAAKSGTTIDKSVITQTQAISKSATDAIDSAKAALAPGLTETASQIKNMAARIDVSKLKTASADLASSLPAAKAKDWRATGVAKDSQGRLGSFFYNAGKYAVTTLSADVQAPPATSNEAVAKTKVEAVNTIEQKVAAVPVPAPATISDDDPIVVYKREVTGLYNMLATFISQIKTTAEYNKLPELSSIWKTMIGHSADVADIKGDASVKTELDQWVRPYRDELTRLAAQAKNSLS